MSPEGSRVTRADVVIDVGAVAVAAGVADDVPAPAPEDVVDVDPVAPASSKAAGHNPHTVHSYTGCCPPQVLPLTTLGQACKNIQFLPFLLSCSLFGR